MIRPSTYRDLASGQTRGLGPTVVRSLLWTIAQGYGLGVAVRNRRYDRGRAEIVDVGVPVISVGNLTLGGTGKTPLTAWIASWYRDHKIRAAIVSRGYGSAAGPNDEARQLAQELPEVPHVQDPDRVKAAREAIEQYHSELLLLDDGFQHRRLRRDLDIVVIDALDPFGCDHLFPRGLLREPPVALARANLVVLSRVDLIPGERREFLEQRLASLSHGAPLVEVSCKPDELCDVEGRVRPVSALAGERVMAFCGIGNPLGFRRTLQRVGANLVGWREFPDHYLYNDRDLAAIVADAEAHGANLVVCTEKDLVKLTRRELGGRPLFALRVRLAIQTGQHELEQRLAALAAYTRRRPQVAA